MARVQGRTLALLAGLAVVLPACAARTPPVQVTRFHLNQPIAPGTVRVSAGEHSQLSLEQETYISAIERQMTRLGFQPVRGTAPTTYLAVVDLNTAFRPGGQRGSPVSIGIGGGSFGGGRRGGVGLGGGIGFPIGGGGRRSDIAVSDLSLRLMRRAGEETIWEGRVRAEASARSPESQPAVQADRMANALFAGFPGESGRTISIP